MIWLDDKDLESEYNIDYSAVKPNRFARPRGTDPETLENRSIALRAHLSTPSASQGVGRVIVIAPSSLRLKDNVDNGGIVGNAQILNLTNDAVF